MKTINKSFLLAIVLTGTSFFAYSQNLALLPGTTATVTTNWPGYEGSKVLDNNNTTFWASTDNSPLPQDVTIALPGTATAVVTSVRLIQTTFANANMYRTKDFTIDSSIDGVNIDLNIANGTLLSTDGTVWNSSTFSPAKEFKYLRVNVSSSYSAVQTCGLAEVKYFGYYKGDWDEIAPSASEWGNDGVSYEMGTKFAVSTNGVITALKVYYWAGTTLPSQTLRLWNAAGTLIGSANLDAASYTESGWKTATLASPVEVTTGVDYTVSYTTPTKYSKRLQQFNGVWNRADNVIGKMGVYNSTTATMPASSFSNANYFVDVTFAYPMVVTSSTTQIFSQPTNLSSLTVNPGGKVTLNNGVNLAIGTLTLESNGSGTATFVDNGGTLSATTTNVQQYLATTRNWYVSSPVSNAVAPANYSFYSRYEPGGTATGWTSVSVGAGLTAGKGYIALPATAGVPITFTTQSGGSLNNGTITIPLTYTTVATSGKGYNLIGNPYPSHLKWTYEFTQANATKIESTIWYRTNSVGSNASGWSFVTFNPVTAETVPSTVNGGIIPPMQAFWVLAKDVVDNSIQFTNAMRSHETGNPLKAPAAKNVDRKKVRLQVSNGTRADEALLVFDANASDNYDAYDSPKMMNNATDIADIYTVADTKNLVINGMSNVKFDTEIPVGFATATAGDFSISTSEFSNFKAGTRLILLDKNYPTQEFEITPETAYHFSAPITTASTDRFSLLFRAPGVTTGIDNGTKLNAQVFVNAANQITIIGAEKSSFAVYNAMGQLISAGVTTSNYQTSNFKLSSGIYFVSLSVNGQREIKKVITN